MITLITELLAVAILVLLLIIYITDTTNSDTISFTTINKNAETPTRATEGSAGYDFYLPETIVIDPGESVLVDTGVTAQFSKNYVLMLYMRSSIGIKHKIMLANGTGVIDSDYKDTIKLPLYNYNTRPVVLHQGDRIAQCVCTPYLTGTDKPIKKHRRGGLGSTGR